MFSVHHEVSKYCFDRIKELENEFVDSLEYEGHRHKTMERFFQGQRRELVNIIEFMEGTTLLYYYAARKDNGIYELLAPDDDVSGYYVNDLFYDKEVGFRYVDFLNG